MYKVIKGRNMIGVFIGMTAVNYSPVHGTLFHYHL